MSQFLARSESRAEPGDPVPVRRGLVARFWPHALLLAVGMCILLPRLGQFGFWDPWEPKYAESAREMTERGSFIVPYYRDDVRLTKPILVYWGILAGAAVFGLNELGARIVGVGAALAALLGVYYAVSRLRGRTAGILCSLVLATLPQFYLIARQAMPDVYLFTSLGSCLVFFALALYGPERRSDLHFGISYACFSLAVLAKGPIVAGAIFFPTLAVTFLLSIDPAALWEPAKRRATLRLALVALPSILIGAALLPVAFLFGTSPNWWGYSERTIDKVTTWRFQLLEAMQGVRAPEILLVAVAAIAILCGVRLLRKRRKLLAFASLGFGLLALLPLSVSSPVFRAFAASALTIVTCLVAIYASIARFLAEPWLRPVAIPWIRTVARQVGLFALVFLVVAGPWHLAILIEQGHGYFTDFILKHNIERATDKINSTGQSDFYLGVMIFGFFPWSAFLPMAIVSSLAWREREAFRRVGFETFLLVACAVTFTVLSIAVTKFAHYLAPMLLPLAILIGLCLHRSIENPRSTISRLTWLSAAMLFVLPALDLLRGKGSYLIESFTMKSFVPPGFEIGPYYPALIALMGVLLLAGVLVRARPLVFAVMLTAGLMANFTAVTFVPHLTQYKTMKNLCDTWRKQGGPLGFHGDLKHGIFFYSSNQVQYLDKATDFNRFMDPRSPASCIVEQKGLAALTKGYQSEYPGHRLSIVDRTHLEYLLVSNQPERPPS